MNDLAIVRRPDVELIIGLENWRGVSRQCARPDASEICLGRKIYSNIGIRTADEVDATREC